MRGALCCGAEYDMMMKPTDQPIIVSGLSGAGLSSVLKAIEDFRFEVMDNMPLSMIPEVLSGGAGRIAIGVDTRTRGFSPEAVLDLVKSCGARLIFITCDDAVLFRRFTETRRRHPLAQDRSVSYGIKAERKLLALLEERADVVIDSSESSIHDLRHMLEGHLAVHPQENLTISLVSFAFRKGLPRDADMVMDVRFLKNPHWNAKLKPLTGLDPAVGAHISEDAGFEGFITQFQGLILPLLPRYAQEGKSYLTVAVGCTGGRHRSVYTVEVLKAWFKGQGIKVFVEHRDLPK